MEENYVKFLVIKELIKALNMVLHKLQDDRGKNLTHVYLIIFYARYKVSFEMLSKISP